MEITRTGDKMMIVVDLNEDGPDSKSGKSKILFSSGGFKPFEDLKIALNVIRKK